ncbi:hypothetical protein EJ08DRAFT_701142 [Tothia fuscella]|uniref:Alpha/beta hydrolase n=1 Tax=Tothia fuscella TaxID=1048955 RepID=A0A9P4TV52_9PEZI|nr:hypothetical protein EJ08DRAFT_701142 [Tothia fuscella]
MPQISTLVSVLAVLPLILAQGSPPSLPAKGENGEIGGIFGMGQMRAPPKLGGPGLTAQGPEFPKPGPRTTNGGSGPYKAAFSLDPSLLNHTIYAPKAAPPASVKLPVLVFGNGGCMNTGTMFEDFLTEIASYGYLVIANGPPGRNSSTSGSGATNPLAGLMSAMGAGQSRPIQLTQSVDWVTKGGPDVTKYGNVDTAHIAAAGQSCGGLEAYSASYHDDRIKLTILFNSGVIAEEKTYLLKELKAPVGYFLGGPLDIAYPNGERDYPLLPAGLPAMKASLDTGHMGTYGSTGGGKFGKAAVAFLEWQFRGDARAKAKFTDPASEGSLVKDNWNVTTKGF